MEDDYTRETRGVTSTSLELNRAGALTPSSARGARLPDDPKCPVEHDRPSTRLP